MLKHLSHQQCEAMKEFIEESKILSAPNIGCFAKSLVDNALPLLRTSSAHSSLEGTVTEMAVHAAIIFLCGQNRVLAPLRNLAFDPANMAVRSLQFSLCIFRALSLWTANLWTWEQSNPCVLF